MRRMRMALAAVAVLAATGGALAAPPIASPEQPRHAAAEQVQYYQYQPYPDWQAPRDFEERRWLRRQERRAYEEERIAEAARREARRIEIERAERRAWRHAQRERFGYYRGF